MSVSIEFPNAPEVPGEVPLLAVQPPRWSRDAVTELARQFALAGEVTDRGLWHLVTDDRAVLEVYQASHSFRFGRRETGDETTGTTGGDLDADRARAVADEWAGRFAPADSRWDFSSVTELEVLVAEREATEPRRLLAGLQVSYRFTLDGLMLLGPGAKMQVAVDPSGEVSGAYRFWREQRTAGYLPTIPVEQAYDRFSRSDLFADLTDETARARVDEVRIGFLGLPPTEPQGFLTPVYELRGVLSTETHPRYEFVSYVAAARLEDGEAKNSRWARIRPSLVTA
jgi:hypothetical protein